MTKCNQQMNKTGYMGAILGIGNKQPTHIQMSSLDNSLRFFKDSTYLLRLKSKCAFMKIQFAKMLYKYKSI